MCACRQPASGGLPGCQPAGNQSTPTPAATPIPAAHVHPGDRHSHAVLHLDFTGRPGRPAPNCGQLRPGAGGSARCDHGAPGCSQSSIDLNSTISNPQSPIIHLDLRPGDAFPDHDGWCLAGRYPATPGAERLRDLLPGGRSGWMEPPWLHSAQSGVTRLRGLCRWLRPDQLVDSAWAERPAWAIIPFEALEPRWKVLSVDGQSPVHNDFDPASYPLKIAFSASAGRIQPAAYQPRSAQADRAGDDRHHRPGARHRRPDGEKWRALSGRA